MPGFSITTLLLPAAGETGAPDSALLLSLLDEPANVPGWKWSACAIPPAADSIGAGTKKQAVATADADTVSLRAQDVQGFNAAVERACRALGDAEPEITRMDNIAGDGDCGLTLKAGAAGASPFRHSIESRVRGGGADGRGRSERADAFPHIPSLVIIPGAGTCCVLLLLLRAPPVSAWVAGVRLN